MLLSYLELAFLVAYISSAIFDLLVVILTVYRTGRLAMQSKEADIGTAISFILLRDGLCHHFNL